MEATWLGQRCPCRLVVTREGGEAAEIAYSAVTSSKLVQQGRDICLDCVRACTRMSQQRECMRGHASGLSSLSYQESQTKGVLYVLVCVCVTLVDLLLSWGREALLQVTAGYAMAWKNLCLAPQVSQC